MFEDKEGIRYGGEDSYQYLYYVYSTKSNEGELERKFTEGEKRIIVKEQTPIRPGLTLPKGFTFSGKSNEDGEIGNIYVARFTERNTSNKGGLMYTLDEYVQKWEGLVLRDKERRRQEWIGFRMGAWIRDWIFYSFEKQFREGEYFYLSEEAFNQFKKNRVFHIPPGWRSDRDINDQELVCRID